MNEKATQQEAADTFLAVSLDEAVEQRVLAIMAGALSGLGAEEYSDEDTQELQQVVQGLVDTLAADRVRMILRRGEP